MYMHIVTITTVQLKGNLTPADKAHTTWLKAHSLINPYWHVWEEKLPTLFLKRQECWLGGH